MECFSKSSLIYYVAISPRVPVCSSTETIISCTFLINLSHNVHFRDVDKVN